MWVFQGGHMKEVVFSLFFSLALLFSTLSCSSRLARMGDFQIYEEIPDDWDDPAVNLVRFGDRSSKAFIAEVKDRKSVV